MKTTKAITVLAALTATFVCSSAHAESRIWTDTTGKTIEAEQVNVMNDQVLLRLMDGREIRVSLDALSAADRRKAMLNQPPTLDLKVTAKTSRSNSSMADAGRRSRVQIEEESTQVTVAVQKTSSAAYELPLNAVLYVMGERGDGQLEVLNKVSTTLTYSEKGQEFELKSDAFESVKRQAGERQTEYTGWLVTVLDSSGEVVAIKSSKREYMENSEELLAANEGTAFDRDYSILQPTAGTEMTHARWF